jgi:hypothetical protein
VSQVPLFLLHSAAVGILPGFCSAKGTIFLERRLSSMDQQGHVPEAFMNRAIPLIVGAGLATASSAQKPNSPTGPTSIPNAPSPAAPIGSSAAVVPSVPPQWSPSADLGGKTMPMMPSPAPHVVQQPTPGALVDSPQPGKRQLDQPL